MNKNKAVIAHLKKRLMKNPKFRAAYKKKIHIHKFIMERVLYNGESYSATHLHMRCTKCGMAMFVSSPLVHYGDEANRPYDIRVVQYEKPPAKKKKKQ